LPTVSCEGWDETAQNV